MNRHLPNIAGALLGLLFVTTGLMVLLDLGPKPPMPLEGSPPAHFFAAFGPTGYLTFVKVFEVLGGVLTAIPRTRCLGLLVLVPIIVNIIAFHEFVSGDGVMDPMVLGAVALALFLLVVERRAFFGLVAKERGRGA